MPPKERIDKLLVARGLVESRSLAQRMIMAGQVRAMGERILKASQQVDLDVEISIDKGPKYVSRGGLKLEAGLDAFEILVSGRICADVGVSTGGFTDCLLQRGAEKVYAIDVGKGVLHWRLRNHPRIVLLEETNIRWIEGLPEPISLCTIDVSFISLGLVFPTVTRLMEARADLIALVKPQFEAGRQQVGRGGIVRDLDLHKQILEKVCCLAAAEALAPQAAIPAPIRGHKGNQEYLLWCKRDVSATSPAELISRCFDLPDTRI